jgi:hypothetical protein
MGLQTVEEMQDIVIDAMPDGRGGYSVDVESLKAGPATDAPKPAANVDTETGEIIDAPATVVADPDDAALRQVEQQSGNSGFQPTAEEIAEIHAREMAESQGQQQPQQRQRRERGGNSIE